jgi:hypothetical protein
MWCHAISPSLSPRATTNYNLSTQVQYYCYTTKESRPKDGTGLADQPVPAVDISPRENIALVGRPSYTLVVSGSSELLAAVSWI